MLHRFSFTTAAILVGLLGSRAYADPDLTLVRVTINNQAAAKQAGDEQPAEKQPAEIAVSGGSRLAIVLAVLRGLEGCKLKSGSVNVGSWLQLPDVEDTPTKPELTVCVDNRLERGESTAYIAVTPDVPFQIIAAISEELGRCGFQDVRLVSEGTLLRQVSGQ